MQTEGTARRFYADVTVEDGEDGYHIRLDRHPLRTPAKAQLRLPTRQLAEAVAVEWAAQGERVKPASMPVTRLVNVALDRTGLVRPEMIDEVVRYVDGDLTCYRTVHPAGLAARQLELWEPVHDWAEVRFGVRPLATEALQALSQPAPLRDGLRATAGSLDDLRLTALASVAGLAGSALLALGLVEGAWDTGSVFAAIRIEEDWQAGLWSADPEDQALAQERRADILAAEVLVRSLDRRGV
jgi:chaperone required for assembly of F1-ATPase